MFSVGGWYDNFVKRPGRSTYRAARAAGSTILIGPWAHNMSVPFEGVDFGADSAVPVRALQLEWFDQFLMGKDSALLSKPPVKIFVMGADKWREETAWPPEQARTKVLYLESAGKANSLSGDGGLSDGPPGKTAADQFVFDPYTPVPTRGGSVCCNPKVFPWGPMDQRSVEQRKDVLVYSTRPLKREMEVIGPVQAVLYVASSARDTDFTAKLVDVFPDGTARILTDGILHALSQFLESRNWPPPARSTGSPWTPASPATFSQRPPRPRRDLEQQLPRFDRNSNTGGPVEQAAKLVKASQTIYHDPSHPSCLS